MCFLGHAIYMPRQGYYGGEEGDRVRVRGGEAKKLGRGKFEKALD